MRKSAPAAPRCFGISKLIPSGQMDLEAFAFLMDLEAFALLATCKPLSTTKSAFCHKLVTKSYKWIAWSF